MKDIALHVTLFRHGATEWSELHRHTGRTDLNLTDLGVKQAEALREVASLTKFDLVVSSPLRRARRTAELSGFADRVQTDDDLHEWRYGEYEGLTTVEIRELEQDEDWTVWTRPIPGGETVDEVGRRADGVISRLPAAGTVAIFSHGHFLRIFAARWLGMPASAGKHFELNTGSLSVLGFERDTRTIENWNVQRPL